MLQLLQQVRMDFRYALRQMGRAPGFASTAILTLGLGIGAISTLFALVYGVLLRPLSYPEPDRIVRVYEIGEEGKRASRMADPNFTDLSQRSRSFAALAQYQTLSGSLTGEGGAARVEVGQVSRDFFRVLGTEPRLGRSFHPEEQREGAPYAAILSHGFWQRYLGGDADFSEHTLEYGGNVVSVVGVMPPEFDFPPGVDFWIPRELEPRIPSRTALNKKTIGRLAPGVSLERAREEVRGIARQLRQEHGNDTWMADAGLRLLHEEMVGSSRAPLLVFLGAAGILLLIACANVVNLLLARAASREGELAVRMALGVGRLRLLQQFLVESLLLSILGGGLGYLVAGWGVGVLRRLEASQLPRLAELRVGGTVLLFVFAASVVVASVLALLATWRAIAGGARASLVVTRRTRGGGTFGRVPGAFVVSQVALTMMLLVGTGLLLRSFQLVVETTPGYRTDGALVVNSHFPNPQTQKEREYQARFNDHLLSRLRALPGVAEVGAVSTFPLQGSGASGTFLLLSRPDEVTDWKSFAAVAELPERRGQAEYRKATPGYFRAMRIPLLEGRRFDARDRPEGRHVAVVSESLAEAAWPDENPIGQLIQFGNMDGDLRPFTVVGVVGDVRESSLESEPEPTVYANARQRSLAGALHLVIIPRSDVKSLRSTVRNVVREIDPEVAASVRTLEEIFAGSLAERRFQLVLLGSFGATAFLLALVGIYGVMAFRVARRRKAIGVRLALGATAGNVVGEVMKRGLVLAGLGIVVGGAGALAVTRLMESLLYGVTTTDLATFLAVPVVLLLATLLACLAPAYRAARVDPVSALRAE